jgi:hypothetical protein
LLILGGRGCGAGVVLQGVRGDLRRQRNCIGAIIVCVSKREGVGRGRIVIRKIIQLLIAVVEGELVNRNPSQFLCCRGRGGSGRRG